MNHELPRTIVSDPEICRGEPTFRGTRILVADVLEQIASGMAWDAIVEEWRGTISREALLEVMRFEQSEATFPLRGTLGEMHRPFEPATPIEDWSVYAENE